jgi:hypothetical protein
MNEETKKVKWYQRKEVWGTALTLLSFSPEIVNSFVDVGILPEYTLVAKLATPFGLILTALGLRSGYKDNNLPGGLSKAGKKIDNSINKYFNK